MPLSLTDPRWSELRSSYGDTSNVVAWLSDALLNRNLSDERLGDLINEVQHQGGTSTAMYAVCAHLVALAGDVEPDSALAMLIHSGIMHADAHRPGAVACPDFLEVEFAVSAVDGARLLTTLLPMAVDFDIYKWAVTGLAGFIGHHRFAWFLDGLEFHDGQFHHALLDEPFPAEL